MRAALLYGFERDFIVEEIPRPEPGPGEVVVRVAAAGACHSDLSLRRGQMSTPGTRPPFPWVLGHENSGFVEALGDGVSGFEVGEPVVVYGGWGCGLCRVCLGGEEQLCDVMSWCGIGRPGGYAEYLLVPKIQYLARLGDYDPVLAAPLTDAGLSPYRAVKKALARLLPGTTAVVIGVGGLGHFAVQYLSQLSRAKIVAVDPLANKRALATDLGADLVLDPSSVDVAAEVRGYSGGEGAAAVFDFVGADESIGSAFKAVRRQGVVVLVGLFGGSTKYSFFSTAGEVTVTTSTFGNRNELEEVIALARSGAVTARVEAFGLESINDVFARLENGDIEGRAVLTPPSR